MNNKTDREAGTNTTIRVAAGILLCICLLMPDTIAAQDWTIVDIYWEFLRSSAFEMRML